MLLGIVLQVSQGRAWANSAGIFQADSNGFGASNTGTPSLAGPGGTSSIAIGINAQVVQPSGTGDGIAIGTDTAATNTDAIAIGAQTAATGINTIAIGNNGTLASGNNADVFGVGSIGSGDNSSVFGNFASVNSTNGSAFGLSSSVTAIGGSAFGAFTSTTAAYGTALGFGSIANQAGLNGNEAFSNSAVASPYGALSIGVPGSERQIQNVAGGTHDTDAVNVRQLRAVGANAASGLGGGAGYGTASTNYAYTPPSYVIAGQTYHDVASAMSASNNLAVQYTPDGSGNPTAAIDLTRGGALAPTSLTGLAPATTATGAVSLSQLPLQYSTSGAPTTANPATTSNDVTLIGSGGTPVTLHNVAPGALTASSTDAVDGQQLYTTNQDLASLRGSFDTLTAGSTTPGVKFFRANSNGPDSSATGGDAIAVGTSAVASGQNSTAIGLSATAAGINSLALGAVARTSAGGNDIAIGPAAYASGSSATAIGGNSLASNIYSLAAGDTAISSGYGSTAIGRGASATAAQATALGATANAAGQYSLAAGPSASAPGFSSTALGNDATATGAQSVAIGGSGASGSANAAHALATNAVSIGYKSTANNAGDVALGANSTTAAAVGTSGATIGGTAYSFAGTTPTSTVSIGAPGAERTITNLAAGRLSATSTDAVNGSQLYATDQALASLRGQLDNGSLGLVQQNATTRDLTVGANTDGTNVDFANSAGTARTLSKVAGGQIAAGSQQAINGGQAYDMGSSVAGALGGGAALNPDGTISAPHYVVRGSTYDSVGGAIGGLDAAVADIDSHGSKYLAVNTTGAAAAATGADTIALGPASVASADRGVALGANSVASRAGLNGAQEMFSGTAVASTAGAVSVGAAGAERQITNVAGGTAPTDAANIRQLRAVGQSVANVLGGGANLAADGSLQAPSYSIAGRQYASVGDAFAAVDTTGVKYDVDPASGTRGNSVSLQGGDPNQPVLVRNVASGTAPTDAANTGQVDAAKAAAFAYTDSGLAGVQNQLGGVNTKLASLQTQVDQTRTEARQGGAIGLAAASLRYDDRPGKLSAAVGGGVWKGQGATALGLGYVLPEGWGRFNANGVLAGNDFGVGAGASFTLN